MGSSHSSLSENSSLALTSVSFKWTGQIQGLELAKKRLEIKDHTGRNSLAILDFCADYKPPSQNIEEPKIFVKLSKVGGDLEPFFPYSFQFKILGKDTFYPIMVHNGKKLVLRNKRYIQWKYVTRPMPINGFATQVFNFELTIKFDNQV